MSEILNCEKYDDLEEVLQMLVNFPDELSLIRFENPEETTEHLIDYLKKDIDFDTKNISIPESSTANGSKNFVDSKEIREHKLSPADCKQSSSADNSNVTPRRRRRRKVANSKPEVSLPRKRGRPPKINDLIRTMSISTGLDRGLIPKRITGIQEYQGVILHRVEWEDPNEKDEIIPSPLMSAKFPKVVIEYYESLCTVCDFETGEMRKVFQ